MKISKEAKEVLKTVYKRFPLTQISCSDFLEEQIQKAIEKAERKLERKLSEFVII